MFGYQLAAALASDKHEVVIIRPDINPYIHDFKPGKFKEIQIDALKSAGYETFDNFSITRDAVTFEDVGFISKQYWRLGSSFKKLMFDTCLGKSSLIFQ